jgi:hypothetical protein
MLYRVHLAWAGFELTTLEINGVMPFTYELKCLKFHGMVYEELYIYKNHGQANKLNV